MNGTIIMNDGNHSMVIVVNHKRKTRHEWYPTRASRARLYRLTRKAWIHAPIWPNFWSSRIEEEVLK